MLLLFGPGEAGYFRQMAALYSDHYRQVPQHIRQLVALLFVSTNTTYVDTYTVVPSMCALQLQITHLLSLQLLLLFGSQIALVSLTLDPVPLFLQPK